MSPRQPTADGGPKLGPCALPNPEAEAEAEAETLGADLGRDCSEPKLATRSSSEASLPVARALPAEGTLGAIKGTASLTSKPILDLLQRTAATASSTAGYFKRMVLNGTFRFRAESLGRESRREYTSRWSRGLGGRSEHDFAPGTERRLFSLSWPQTSVISPRMRRKLPLQ